MKLMNVKETVFVAMGQKKDPFHVIRYGNVFLFVSDIMTEGLNGEGSFHG